MTTRVSYQVHGLCFLALSLCMACGQDVASSSSSEYQDMMIDGFVSDFNRMDAGAERDQNHDDKDATSTFDMSHDLRVYHPEDSSGDLADLSDMSSDADADEGYRPGYEPCECDFDNAQCSSNTCYLKESTCQEATDCPEGFLCTFTNICVCDFQNLDCRPNCTFVEDCPGDQDKQICDPSGHCAPRPTCDADSHCPSGQWCFDHYCEPAGSIPDRQYCDTHHECQSGYCYSLEGVRQCVPRCLSDDDCMSGESCRVTRFNVCIDHDFGECTVSCPDHYDCHGNQCVPPRCLREEDCPLGSCYLEPRSGNGECIEDGNPGCKRQEFRSSLDQNNPRCYIYKQCNDDSDCASPYTCQDNGWPGIGFKTLCGRTP